MYQPVFKGPIEGWVVNYTKAQFWRLQATMEWDDVMQEAYLVFLRCSNKYPGLQEAKHFMALFKQAWIRQVTDLAYLDSRHRVSSTSTEIAEDGYIQEQVGELDNDGQLSILMRQAPSEVRMVINLFLNAPQEIVDALLSGWTGRDKRCRNGGSARINKALGLDPQMDVLGLVEDYFRQ